MYYRVAIQRDDLLPWQWKSTMLSSLSALLQFLRLYGALPHDRLRVFSSSSREDLEEQIVQENKGLGSNSVTAAQFLQERMIRFSEPACETPECVSEANQQRVAIAVATPPSSSRGDSGVNILDGDGMSTLERRRLQLELGVGGDHDELYKFSLPVSLPEIRAWVKLLTKVQDGA